MRQNWRDSCAHTVTQGKDTANFVIPVYTGTKLSDAFIGFTAGFESNEFEQSKIV